MGCLEGEEETWDEEIRRSLSERAFLSFSEAESWSLVDALREDWA